MTASAQRTGFGPAVEVSETTYSTIAQQVRDMRPSALTPDKFDDVITIIEYMRDQALKIHERNEQQATQLAERELNVTRREREIETKARAVKAAINSQSIAARLRRYFKG